MIYGKWFYCVVFKKHCNSPVSWNLENWTIMKSILWICHNCICCGEVGAMGVPLWKCVLSVRIALDAKVAKFASVCSISFGSNNFVDTTGPLHHPRSHKFKFNEKYQGIRLKNSILQQDSICTKIHKFTIAFPVKVLEKNQLIFAKTMIMISCLHQHHCKNHRNEGTSSDLLRPWFVFVFLFINYK